MALSTYTELKATVADWLNRQDLAAQIPDFIRLLEVQVQRTLRVRQMLGEYTTTIDGTERQMPARLAEKRAKGLDYTLRKLADCLVKR